MRSVRVALLPRGLPDGPAPSHSQLVLPSPHQHAQFRTTISSPQHSLRKLACGFRVGAGRCLGSAAVRLGRR